jgi:hypothetical protein
LHARADDGGQHRHGSTDGIGEHLNGVGEQTRQDGGTGGDTGPDLRRTWIGSP